MKNSQLIDLFQRARKDTNLAVIEGVQALKHAARFKAELECIITSDKKLLETMLNELAPDVTEEILPQAEEVSEDTFTRLSPQPPRTKIIAVAKRRNYKLSVIDQIKPIVMLEDPRDLENIGAVIRVSAAADVAAVCITGSIDVWHPGVIRGGAGLHFALPVVNTSFKDIEQLNRPLVSLDPTGSEVKRGTIEHNAVLIFGTERYGISKELLEKSGQIVRLPMRAGVSSLNLATSVAATLYSL